MKRIMYLCHYARQSDGRTACPAAISYVEYILYLLNKLGYKAVIISPSQSDRFEKRREVVDNNGNTIIYLRSYGKLYKVFHRLMNLLYQADVYKEIVRQTEIDAKMLIYHSVVLMRPVKSLLRKRHVNIVMQTNEIYGDVYSNQKLRKKEIEYLKQAQGYIFTAPKQVELLDASQKPYVIIPGTFKVEDNVKLTDDQFLRQYFTEGRIHVVYAGVLDPSKGAIEAVRAAAFLSEDYHIHIIGFGREEDKLAVQKEIESVKSKTKCSVSYDGCFSGDEYNAFLQNCQIGLCTQKPDSNYNSTSFPSKILSYLTNGLTVLSISIPAIQDSAVGRYIHYYERQDPRDIADAIKKIDVNSINNKEEILNELNDQIQSELKSVMDRIK